MCVCGGGMRGRMMCEEEEEEEEKEEEAEAQKCLSVFVRLSDSPSIDVKTFGLCFFGLSLFWGDGHPT